MTPKLLQVQVLQDFENHFSQWKRGDFGLLAISNLNRRIYGRQINDKSAQLINLKNIVRIPLIFKSKLSDNNIRLADICNTGSRTKLNFNPPIGSFYCERLPKDLKSISPEYRNHESCRAILDFLDDQAICDGYQVRIIHSNNTRICFPTCHMAHYDMVAHRIWSI